MKYRFIENHCSEFHVEKMCHVLNISRSSYYNWKTSGKSMRKTENEKLLREIRHVYEKSRKNYGAPRITVDLNENGIKCGHNRVEKLMRENNIIAKTKKKYKVTTNSKHNNPIAPDLLCKNFVAGRENEVWTSDITYIWTKEGWLYLAVILDIYSRKIVGWSLEKHLRSELVKKALLKAISIRNPAPGLIFHSDRGVQYTSRSIRNLLRLYGMRQSMSEKGNCYGNAITESLFHTLKTEHVYFESYATRVAARQSIFDYIEIYYNRQRRHSAIGYVSPERFEQLNYCGVA